MPKRLWGKQIFTWLCAMQNIASPRIGLSSALFMPEFVDGDTMPRSPDLPFRLPYVVAGSTIPRLIHQTFKSRELPPELQQNVEQIKALNPGWSHRIYDDSDIEAFIRETYGQTVFACYQRINPRYGAARADLFRYLLLYRYGGVYLDIKSTMTRPLDEVLQPNDRYLLSQWQNGKGEEFEGWGVARELNDIPGGEFQQWHIVAAAGHPFLRAVIENVLRNIERYNPWLQGTGSAGVFRVTGPVAYTLAIAPLMASQPHRLASCGDLGFEYTIFKATSHRPLFASHYARQTESVILMQGAAGISAALYNLTKQGKRHIWRYLRGRGLLA
jgi:hypothetical protein